jgi:hypothetical protein
MFKVEFESFHERAYLTKDGKRIAIKNLGDAEKDKVIELLLDELNSRDLDLELKKYEECPCTHDD